MANRIQPSLSIGLADDVTRARLQAAPGLETDLRRLGVSFRTGRLRLPGVLEVAVDELLTNLAALNTWPHQADGDVAWDARLSALVIDSIQDAQAVAAQLQGSEPNVLSAESVLGVLEPRWRGALTS